MIKFLWVVEMRWDGEYFPTFGVSLSRAECRDELKRWRENNPGDTFRLAKYKRDS